MADYVGWIIAAICLGMVVWPILHIIPSKTQKRQIAFRQAAIKKGIQVQIRTPELPRQLASQQDQLTMSVAYHLPAIHCQLTSTYTAIRSHNNKQEWLWLKRQPNSGLQDYINAYAKLPEYILAVEQSASGTTLFWREKGDIIIVDTIFEYLTTLNLLITKERKQTSY